MRGVTEDTGGYVPGRDEVIALVFGGSVAKGVERVDSDLDAMVIVTPEYFEGAYEGEPDGGVYFECTYEGGYFDIKYMTKEYLMARRRRAVSLRGILCEVEGAFPVIRRLRGLWQGFRCFRRGAGGEAAFFYSDLQLNYNYFWKCCKPDGYMKIRTASEIVYALYRLVLQENRVLFPSNRRLEDTVAGVENKPEGLVENCREFCETMDS